MENKTVSDIWQSGPGGKLVVGCGSLIIALLSFFIIFVVIEIVAPNDVTKQLFAIFESDPQTKITVENSINSENALAPDPSSIVPDTPQETAYQIFQAYLEGDETAISSLMGEFATNECKQNYGTLIGCIDSNYTSRGLQNLQEWRVTGEDPNASDEYIYFAFVTTYWAEQDSCLHLIFETVDISQGWTVSAPLTEVRECQ